MNKIKLPVVKNEEGESVIQCTHCGDFKHPHHDGASFCDGCVKLHKKLLEQIDLLIFAENYAEEVLSC